MLTTRIMSLIFARQENEVRHMKKILVLRNIAALRHRDGLSQEELGQLIGASQQAVGKWETGVANPGTKKLLAMADVFGCSLDTLIGREPIGRRRATIEEKLLEFKALDEGSPTAADIDPLTREVWQKYKADPQHFDKVARSMQALMTLDDKGGPQSLTEMIETVLAA
jgi:transcriptional regulator with XRE-family HTH domain